MIILSKGDLLKCDAEALVNAVNCVGTMGKGIALQFKEQFPDNFMEYEAACRKKQVTLGKMFVHQVFQNSKSKTKNKNVKYIINFPTKRHWRDRSYLQDIESGLLDLFDIIKELNIKSIAIPALGCGYGGLKKDDVLPLIEETFNKLDVDHNVTVYLYWS